MKLLLSRAVTFLALLLVTGCTLFNQKSAKSNSREIKLALSDSITTLDPRKTHGMASVGIVQMLFEGLTRVDSKGNVMPGVAKSIRISPDMKTYTFSLKEGKWSNGDLIKATDFEYSWKSQLSAETRAPASYLLFAIKSAEEALNGTSSLDQVGIKAIDDKTLVVTLENPTPYFLQLTATPTYFPVNKKLAEEHPENHIASVSNGPFSLNSWKPHETILLKKNSSYSSADEVPFDTVTFSIIDGHTATTMFKQGTLDWIGSPFSGINQEGLSSFKAESRLKTAPAAGTFFLRVNTETSPFNNPKIRQAFDLAIDRQAIISEAMTGEGSVATGFVPPSLGLSSDQYKTSYDALKATQLFEEALSDMHMTREQLLPITFCFIASDTTKKIAEILQKTWKAAFEIEIILEESDSASFYEKVFLKDYTLATGSWFADYFDPMSFLSIFQYKADGANDTGWSNTEYTRLLDASCLETDPQKRKALLQQAQDILMNDLPIMPILHFSFVYANNEKMEEVTLSPLGTLQ